MDLPDKVNLTRCDTGVEELALIKTMTREDAKTYIDGQWWAGLGSTLTDPNEEPDRHWRWREILSTYQNKPFFGQNVSGPKMRPFRRRYCFG